MHDFSYNKLYVLAHYNGQNVARCATNVGSYKHITGTIPSLYSSSGSVDAVITSSIESEQESQVSVRVDSHREKEAHKGLD